MFCPNCGTENPDGSKFCTSCGKNMLEKAESGPPPELKYEIKGSVLQTVEINIPAGERVFSETGGMLWMDETIELETS
ncbi:MAG TPA: zinc-ribbon domain-containing protein, partial [bacterium]